MNRLYSSKPWPIPSGCQRRSPQGGCSARSAHRAWSLPADTTRNENMYDWLSQLPKCKFLNWKYDQSACWAGRKYINTHLSQLPWALFLDNLTCGLFQVNLNQQSIYVYKLNSQWKRYLPVQLLNGLCCRKWILRHFARLDLNKHIDIGSSYVEFRVAHTIKIARLRFLPDFSAIL